MLMQLEAAYVLRCCGVRRASKESGKAPDVTNVILLRVRAQTP